MKSLIAFATALFLLTGCNPNAQEPMEEVQAPVSRHPEWVKSANIYEVNVRQYTPEGTLQAFEAHLPRLKEMGVDILWFMPIQPIGVENRKGELGSYYSIADYTAVNPEFGTLEDFKRVVRKAHELGMYVILDWVANHTAFDHHWVAEHPAFYTADSLGNRPVVAIDNEGNPTDWTDVADLDYTNKDLWPAMTEEMRFWITDCAIDGFRCDVAGFVPVDFWNQAVASLKETNPELFMLMEWEAPEYMGAFNMGYGWELHHEMNEVAQGKKAPQVFTAFATKFDSAYSSDDMLMYFTTNHDENAWNGTIEERMGPAAKAMFVFATTFQNGMPLIYSGQEAGLNHRLRFFAKDTISWENMELATFYADMLRLKHENPALWNGHYGGAMKVIPTEHADKIYAYYREKDGNRVVVFLNLSNEKVNVDGDFSSIAGEYTYPDGTVAMFNNTNSGALEPWGYLILTQNIAAQE